ncbi:hypothetical protein J6590_098662, partial [Homalodisca vitripennis]
QQDEDFNVSGTPGSRPPRRHGGESTLLLCSYRLDMLHAVSVQHVTRYVVWRTPTLSLFWFTESRMKCSVTVICVSLQDDKCPKKL